MSDSKQKSYEQITASIQKYANELDNRFADYFAKSSFSNKNPIVPIIKDFLLTKGKRLRSNLIFLLTKALDAEINEFVFNLALTQEFIHNATLIHDDIIDCSVLRRGEKTLNFKYDSKLAVLAGDYLLSEAMRIINTFENTKIQQIHSKTLSEMINGELQQYFNRYKLLSTEEYIEKSKAKTAKLFECGLTSICLHIKKEKHLDDIRDFALNFGTAFQIKNDLDNLKDTDKLNEDLKNGDYSAPIIFYAQGKKLDTNKLLINSDKMIKELEKTNALQKTRAIIKQFSDNAIENIAFIEDNLYKQSLTDLCKLIAKD